MLELQHGQRDQPRRDLECPRILVADDHAPTRAGVRLALESDGFIVSAEDETAERAIATALADPPDLCLLDVDMPGGGGPRAAVQIREALPDVRIVAISADDSQSSQYDMMRAGAVGFLTKGAADDEILRVIRSSARW